MSRWIRLALEPPRLLSPPSLPATLLCSCGPCNLNWITFDQLSTFKWPCDIRVQYQSKFWILGVLELLGQHGFLIGFLIRNWNTQFLGFWHLDYSLDFRFLWCFLVFSTWLESLNSQSALKIHLFSLSNTYVVVRAAAGRVTATQTWKGDPGHFCWNIDKWWWIYVLWFVKGQVVLIFHQINWPILKVANGKMTFTIWSLLDSRNFLTLLTSSCYTADDVVYSKNFRHNFGLGEGEIFIHAMLLIYLAVVW